MQGLSEIRCNSCGKMLAKSNIGQGTFEIKCPRCGSLNSIFHEVPDQVILTDTHGKILFVNGAVEKITGYNSQEIIGKTPALWGGQMPKEFYENLWRTILVEKKTISTKITNRHKSGQLYEAKLVISPIFDADENILFFIGTESFVKNL